MTDSTGTTETTGTDVALARIVVGYSATATGQDALRLGIAIARDRKAHLHIVMVAPQDTPFASAQPFDHSYETILEEQMRGWLDEAAAQVPGDIASSTHLFPGDSAPEALLTATRELGAGLVVIGARAGGLLRRHRLGTMASHLLHASHVPIALAPTGYSHPGPLGHVTAMFGQRRGVTDLIGEAIVTARHREIPLRLVSLVTLDKRSGRDSSTETQQEVLNDLDTYGNRRLAEDASELVEEGRASTEIATGRDVTEAMSNLSWSDDEIVLVASSRLAPRGRLFLGTTATKMLRVAPVPVIVIPSGYSLHSTDPTTLTPHPTPDREE